MNVDSTRGAQGLSYSLDTKAISVSILLNVEFQFLLSLATEEHKVNRASKEGSDQLAVEQI